MKNLLKKLYVAFPAIPAVAGRIFGVVVVLLAIWQVIHISIGFFL